MNQPLYQHDCEACVYFKTDKDDFGTLADIYICGECVTYRYSDEPADNRSVCFGKQREHGDLYIERYSHAYDLLQQFKKQSS